MKSKMPFVVAGITLIAVIITLILLLVLGGLKKDSDNRDAQNITEDIPAEDTSTSEQISSGTLEETVVYDDNNVQLTVFSIEQEDGFLTITGRVENKMNTHVKLAAQGIAFNGVSIYGYMSSDVLEKSTAEWSLSVYDSSFEVTGIKKINDLTVYFEVDDADSYDILSAGNFKYEMDQETAITPKYDLSRFADVYEDEYCTVSACQDIVYDENSYYTVLCVENKMDIPVSIMFTDTIINGVKVNENLGWEDIIPRSVVYAEVFWYADDLTEECMTFEDIEMGFDFYDHDSFESYTSTIINYQTDGVAK